MKYLEFTNKALESALIEGIEVDTCKASIVNALATPLTFSCDNLSMVKVGLGRAIYSAIQASVIEQMEDGDMPEIVVISEPKNYISFGMPVDYIYLALIECANNNWEGVVGNIYHAIKGSEFSFEQVFDDAIKYIEEV